MTWVMRGARLKSMGGAKKKKKICFVHLTWQNGLCVHVCLTRFGHVMWIHFEAVDIFVVGHSHCYTPSSAANGGETVAKSEAIFCGLTANSESDQSCRSQLKKCSIWADFIIQHIRAVWACWHSDSSRYDFLSAYWHFDWHFSNPSFTQPH